jgi:hypothetical protein
MRKPSLLRQTANLTGGNAVALATVERAQGSEIRRDTVVDQRLTLFRTVDRLGFGQTQEQDR